MLVISLLGLPLLTSVLCRAVRSARVIAVIHAVGAFATLCVGLVVVGEVFATGPLSPAGELLYVDQLSAVLISIIVVLDFAAALYSIGYLQREVQSGEVPASQLPWYYCGYHAFIWTMLVTVSVNNLGLLWVAVEATTLVSALLVGFYRTPAALEAAWKYLILCTVGIVIALFGVLLTYYASTRLAAGESGLDWTVLMAHAGQLDPNIMRLAFVFVLIGFGTKAGLAPLHSWLPDAHSQAPSPISALLSGVLLECALYAIFRFHMLASVAVPGGFSARALVTLGLISVSVAVPFILVQRDLKRLLAYSSVEHVGLIATAIGLGGSLGLYAGALHLFNHAIAKALLFFVAGNLTQRYGTTRMSRIRGVVRAMPATGGLLLMGMFAITGLPPFAIFLSEFGIVGAGFAQGNWLAVVVLIVALGIVFAAAFGHALDMAFGRPRASLEALAFQRLRGGALAIPAGFMVLLGVYMPPALNTALQQVAGLLANGPR